MLHLRLKTLFIGLTLASRLMLLTFGPLARYNGATERLASASPMRVQLSSTT